MIAQIIAVIIVVILVVAYFKPMKLKPKPKPKGPRYEIEDDIVSGRAPERPLVSLFCNRAPRDAADYGESLDGVDRGHARSAGTARLISDIS